MKMTRMLILPDRPWKTTGVDTGVIMGQFHTKAEAQKYADELMRGGSCRMGVKFYVGTDEKVGDLR